MGIMIYIIIRYRKEIGLAYYLPSLIVLYAWTVFVTIMHHHDETNVWKKDPKAINGIIESVDRHYGIFHSITHNIGTHQVHHLCPQIPHYNLPAATFAFRKEFPELCKVSTKNPFLEFFRISSKSFKNRKLFKKNIKYKKFSSLNPNLIEIE